MSIGLKLFLYFVVGPMALAFTNGSLSSYQNFQWGYDHVNEISMTAFVISGAASLYLLLNKKNSTRLRIISGVFLLISAGFFYTTYSFSNFGF
ncbi:MAG: hypothetical protein A3B86_00820 [Candidatus Yanofskybacteria bacterium RIFCSPHIGHO2_02_FULL_38_22b]|uniref:Uncharacterized protein n=1 Tax=Candidatus Yanofskybacteria bacterium RIFCSPHIGHO2_02_FULL_38_22b TaxID=1802673 RepID=A0A1F8F621_9BACT|nr:MAG: hypothetical protein A2816_02710 [Candidatus Yanofskybacteria bacterium RIFCSPHIGHO2_01_FULL_39_44]OGN07706.1 MAG: hypothetical protein A3B86_00820 [Candidatus Yanofskybacteria bacterium RIFCSPHIGHO2_02_FULL_38_22b]